MAWHLIKFQLYIARRLYREERQPSLNASNLESVRHAASALTGDRKGAFALFSDTTSFVQLGDLIVADLDEGALKYVEVKSGDHNKRILDVLQFHAQGHCDGALALFLKAHGKPWPSQLWMPSLRAPWPALATSASGLRPTRRRPTVSLNEPF